MAKPGLSKREYRVRVARRLGISDFQVRYALRLFGKRRDAGDADVTFSLVNDKALRRISELIDAFCERRNAERRSRQYSARHYPPTDFGAVMAAAAALPKLKSE
jgi:hypothetical protein